MNCFNSSSGGGSGKDPRKPGLFQNVKEDAKKQANKLKKKASQLLPGTGNPSSSSQSANPSLANDGQGGAQSSTTQQAGASTRDTSNMFPALNNPSSGAQIGPDPNANDYIAASHGANPSLASEYPGRGLQGEHARGIMTGATLPPRSKENERDDSGSDSGSKGKQVKR